MKVSGSRLTADSSVYVFACISQNPLNTPNFLFSPEFCKLTLSLQQL